MFIPDFVFFSLQDPGPGGSKKHWSRICNTIKREANLRYHARLQKGMSHNGLLHHILLVGIYPPLHRENN
jgi:hypothetical protein